MSSEMPVITIGIIRDFLRDALPADRMAAIERAARSDSALMATIANERDAMNRGDHSLGSIWQEHQVSCPTREQLGSYLIQAIDPDHAAYILFHLTVIECAVCSANLDDLKVQSAKVRNSTGPKAKRRK
jgi:hypothetical protein